MLPVRELVWDDWNEAHIARHGVRSDEVEEACFGRALGVRIRRGMYRLIGQTGEGRYLVVILAARGKTRFYVATSRDATEAEKRRFRLWRGR